MFKIYDGRNELYQWDKNRKLIISDAAVDSVHFCNKTGDCSLVVEVREEDGLRVADIPNILLQTAWPIRAYAYCGGCYTKESATFKINARTKPTDYVYTETEIKSWEKLEEEIGASITDLQNATAALNEATAQIGDISTALDALHTYAQSVIGGNA